MESVCLQWLKKEGMGLERKAWKTLNTSGVLSGVYAVNSSTLVNTKQAKKGSTFKC